MYGVVARIKTDPSRAVLPFDSREQARATAEHIRSEGPLAGELVDLENVDSYDVLYRT
jgi:hypothetical protein